MRTPLVSACIGTYNKQDYIRQTIDSVLSQSYHHLEVVVVDDASTDGTLDILLSYGNAIRLIQREHNSGMCPITRNQAIRASKGEYIALLDADDIWYPTKIEKQIDFMTSQPDIPLVHTYCNLIDSSSSVCGIRHEGHLPATGDYFASLLRHCIVTISSVMCRRTLFDDVGYFTEDKLYGIWGEDIEFFLRVAKQYRLGLIDEVLAGYRKHDDNISSGNWMHTPESVPLHRLLISREDIWRGRVPKKTVIDAFVENALINCRHWSYQGYLCRPLYFLLLAVKHDPLNRNLYEEGARALARKLLRRSKRAIHSQPQAAPLRETRGGSREGEP